MTAREIALLAQRIIDEFPQYYSYFSEKDFTYNGIKQGNRNPLIYGKVIGDGLKTGHTEEAGYGLTASAKQGDTRLILVVNGLSSMNERASESARLMDMGFRDFQTYALFRKGDQVETAEVWLGDAKSVPLIVDRDIALTLNRNMRKDLKATVKYLGPVPAPIAKGTPVGTLSVTAPGKAPLDIPLVAGESVEKLGVVQRIGAAMRHVFMGPQG
jgi:D-alanyl-D-alanine carboxypeptidase (penicillin-binding protein 5/6)